MKKIFAIVVAVLFALIAFSSVVVTTRTDQLGNDLQTEDPNPVSELESRAPSRIPYTTRTCLDLKLPAENDDFGYLDDVEIKGNLYEDFNGNQSFDDGEDFPITDAPIHIYWAGDPDNHHVVHTNEEGNFTISIKNEEKYKGPTDVAVEYNGQYTVNGSEWFEVEQKLGFNDDNDFWFDLDSAGDHPGNGIWEVGSSDAIVEDCGLWPEELDSSDIVKYDPTAGCPKYFSPPTPFDGELIDEEFPNGDDDDGDWDVLNDDVGPDGVAGTGDPGEGNGVADPGEPNVDEDLNYTFFRKPTKMQVNVTLWHAVDITFDVLLKGKVTERVTVGDEISIKGRIKDVIDATTSMNSLPLKFEIFNSIPPEMVRTDTNGDFNFTLQKTAENEAWWNGFWDSVKVGYRSIKVIFDPEHWEPGSKYHLYAKTEEKFVRVYRTTYVEFEATGDDAVGYLYKPIIINGSIRDNKGNPLLEKISHDDGTDETILAEAYRLFFEWGTEMDRFYDKREFDITPEGHFSINFIISDPYQVLGPVTVTISITTNLTQTYYQPCTGSNTYIVRGFTDMEMWIDQDSDGIYSEVVGKNKEGSTADFITRVPYKDAEGNTHNWQIVTVYGRLFNRERPSEGIDVRDVTYWWDDEDEKKTVQTSWVDLNKNGKEDEKEDGVFTFQRIIDASQPLGPIVVNAEYDGEDGYFDSAYSKETFYVVATTELILLGGDVIKGENATIKGRLVDDRGTGVPNQNISLYWEDREGDLFSGSGGYKQGGLLIDPADKYDEFKLQEYHIGDVMTDSSGYFQYTGYEIPKDKSVGQSYIVAIYEGSTPPYTVSNSWIGSDSDQIPYNVTAYTIIDLQTKYKDMDFTRGDSFKIEGELVEAYQGTENSDYPVLLEEEEINKITIWINTLPAGAQGENVVKIRDYKKGQFTYEGEIPRDLPTGIAPLELNFNGTKKYLPSIRTTYHLIWTDIYFEIYRPEAVEIEGEKGKWAIENIRENRFDKNHKHFVEPGLQFTIGLFEKNAPGDQQIPVENATVWLNISSEESVFINFSKGMTSSLGLITFTFDSPLVDSEWGHTLGTTFSEQLNISVTFQGGEYRRPNQVNILTTHQPAPEKESDDPLTAFLDFWIYVIFVVIIIFLIAFFIFMSWYRKQQRIRGIKRIIKRAADQLIAGNEYTYVIFKSYQKLGAHLRKYGYLRRDSETFREFEDAVRTVLPIDRVSMDRFLGLLEEARYSQHDIGEDQRNKAIVNLRNVERSLETIIIDESAALLALERLEEEDEGIAETTIQIGSKEQRPVMPQLLKGAGDKAPKMKESGAPGK